MGDILAFGPVNETCTDNEKTSDEVDIQVALCDDCDIEFNVEELYVDHRGKLICPVCIDKNKNHLSKR